MNIENLMHIHTHAGTYMYTKIYMQTCLHKHHTHKNKEYEHMPHTYMRTHSQHTHTKRNEKKNTKHVSKYVFAVLS